jgi:hypothetical protein
LTFIGIPGSVKTIGANAFQGASSLTEITIPASVTEIGINAFQDSGLTTVYIPRDNNLKPKLDAGSQSFYGRNAVNVIYSGVIY